MACYSDDVMGGAFYFTQSVEYIYTCRLGDVDEELVDYFCVCVTVKDSCLACVCVCVCGGGGSKVLPCNYISM